MSKELKGTSALHLFLAHTSSLKKSITAPIDSVPGLYASAWVWKPLVVVSITFCGVKGSLNGILPVIGSNISLTMPRNGPLNSRCTLQTVKNQRWADLGWMRCQLPCLLRVFFQINDKPLERCHLSGCVVGMGWGCDFDVSLHTSLSEFYRLTINIPVYALRCFPTDKHVPELIWSLN